MADDFLKHHDIDGILTNTSNGFWMIRSSNTMPHLTIRCEAATDEGLEETMDELKHFLALAGVGEEKLCFV